MGLIGFAGKSIIVIFFGWYEKVSLEFSFSSMIHRIMAHSVETGMNR